ncbi:LUD domain-containing protein [Microlunatus spumicola]|uniref:LUD domain-containing protein n=1 Tax=Microlunatus spumicola TaxID=81499 RepID=A0ABP6WYB3_9ACTN
MTDPQGRTGSAREAVLGRIRDAHRLAPPPDLPYEAIARDYRRERSSTTEELVELLVDRLVDYKARVRRSTPDELATTIAAALAEQGARTVAVPPGVEQGWFEQTDVDVRRDRPDEGAGLTVDTLDGLDGVVTACALAVAETGTIVLDASLDQGRRLLTLVPDYHLCVVRADQVVPDVPQALALLDPVRPTTMISGPSATSDIELNRVEGVHGPRTLEVVVVS